MGQKKKVGKERLDKYYHLAKEQGYRARSAFKLVQLNKKFGFLENAKVLVDLCAAPGGWLQVASKYMPASNLIVGIDLVPIKPIPNVTTFACDITSDKCRSELKKELKTWKVDVFLNDGAPNVGAAWSKDAYSQSELVLSAFKLATEFLNERGWFVTKVFRSKDYNNLLWIFNQLFEKVEATKPPSSRNVSAEIFVVCKGFLAPKKIDPKFFDPKFVFEEIDVATKAANIFHPEKHTRQRQGYEDGVSVLFKSCEAMEYIDCEDPATFLGSYNTFTFDRSKKLASAPETTEEIKECCKDLRVLGKKDFKTLIKWRMQIRNRIYPKTEAIPVIDNEESDSEADLEKLSKEAQKKRKREKRKRLERKAKQRIRMQLGMSADGDLATDQIEQGLFALKTLDPKTSKSQEMIENWDSDKETEEEDEDEETSPEELENQLESQYEIYQEQLMLRDPKLIVKKKRNEELPFNGIEDFRSSSEEEGDEDQELIVDLEKEDKEKAVKTKADLWFSNPIFKEIEEEESEDEAREGKRQTDYGSESVSKKAKKRKALEEDKDEGFELVKRDTPLEEFTEEDKLKLLSAEGMSLAVHVKRSREDVIDASFNRYAFNDHKDLPSWFKDDESKHNKPQIPITKEGVALLKEKMKSITSRPIKKVLEAKGRKKMKALKKMDALKKKAAVIADSEEMTEKEKSEQISKVLRNSVKSKKKAVKVVVAKGVNRGNKGRPGGVKGKYKMVDKRLMKDTRAVKAKKKRDKK